jgi:hypothetical protein
MNPGASGFNEISGGHHRGILCGICVDIKGHGNNPDRLAHAGISSVVGVLKRSRNLSSDAAHSAQ